MAMTRLRISCYPFQMCSRKTRHDRGSERFERFPVVRALAKSDVHPVRAGAGERGDRLRRLGGRAAEKSGHAARVVRPVLLVQLLMSPRAALVRAHVEADVDRPRSEERRVGKECRSWWSA